MTETFIEEDFVDVLNIDCARTSLKRLNNGRMIRKVRSGTTEDPLLRFTSLSTSVTDSSRVSREGVLFDERLHNLETHFGVLEKTDRNTASRIKTLEDKILKVETNYPQIASHVFNYGKAEIEASNRPGGRVSKAAGPYKKVDTKSSIKNEITLDPILDEKDFKSNSKGAGLAVLRRKISNLRNKLKQFS